jgi:hypothetical protein
MYMPGKRVQFEDEKWASIDLLTRDRLAPPRDCGRGV